MTSNDFHLHFESKGQDYDVDFQQQAGPSESTVMIDGRNYALHGDDQSISGLLSQLPNLETDAMTFADLKKGLVESGAKELDVTLTVHSLGVRQLAPTKESSPKTQTEGKWAARQKASLPGKRKAVAQKYFQKHSARFAKIAKAQRHIDRLETQLASTSDRSRRANLSLQLETHKERLDNLRQVDAGIIGFLKWTSATPDKVDPVFQKALETRDPSLFATLFNELSPHLIFTIDYVEGLDCIPRVELSSWPVEISKTDLNNIRDFIRDDGFSGAVTLSDRMGTYTVSSEDTPDPQAPYAIHSVGKVFTGVLALRLLEEGVISESSLSEPIQLDSKVVSQLPPNVQNQLKNTTLRQVMLHQGRYGDYLAKYTEAIKTALQDNKPAPLVETPEDFLSFADTELVELDLSGEAYSNLGLLLVGLSIQHLYRLQNESDKTYDQLLDEYVLKPADIQLYQKQMPEGARVNPEDIAAPHVTGGPAGGAWSTVGDLTRMGDWLSEKCRDPESRFKQLLEEFGGEFYGQREISHGGSVDSASAHISHRLDNGVTLSVVSDMTGFANASFLATRIQDNLLRKSSLERVVDHALPLLFADPSAAPSNEELVELFQKKENLEILEKARTAPPSREDDSANITPTPSGFTEREGRMLQAVMDILENR